MERKHNPIHHVQMCTVQVSTISKLRRKESGGKRPMAGLGFIFPSDGENDSLNVFSPLEHSPVPFKRMPINNCSRRLTIVRHRSLKQLTPLGESGRAAQ